MRVTSVFAISIVALAVAGQAFAQTTEPADRSREPVVVTTGEALVRMPPDRAYLVLATETRAPKPAEAQQKNAEAMSAVMQKLSGLNLPKDAVRTLSVSLNEEYDFVNNRRMSRGYRASNAIEVRIDDIARVGEVLDAAVAAGATTVSEVRFDLKDRDAAERQALRLAVLDARARADAAAAGAGSTVVRVLRVEEAGRPGPPRPMEMMAMRADSAPQTPVTPGEIEIAASVRLTAAIK